MKRLFLILAFLLFTLRADAGMLMMGGGTPAAGGGCDSCTGGLIFSWHGETTDVTTGTPCGCSVGATTLTAMSGATLSTTQKKDGSYSISIPTSSDLYYCSWANDIVTPTAGRIDFWVYFTTIGDQTVFATYVDASNYVTIWIDSSNTYLGLTYAGGGTVTYARTNTTVITTGTWYHVIAQWDHTAHGGLYQKIACDTTTGTANSNDNGTDALGTWSGSSGSVSFGDYYDYAGVYYLDNIKIYNSW